MIPGILLIRGNVTAIERDFRSNEESIPARRAVPLVSTAKMEGMTSDLFGPIPADPAGQTASGQGADDEQNPLDVGDDRAGASIATVAIVGRPNVGKSALFNRLIGKRLAIVDDTPGVTRDRIYGQAQWRGRSFGLVDTAGIDADTHLAFSERTRAQAEAAAQVADVILLVVDAALGRNPLDDEVAEIVRRTRRPVLLVANKAESERARMQVAGEFVSLGFGMPIEVSALHGEGTGDLLDAIVDRLPENTAAPDAEASLSLAFIGRPNVGKSSLLNALLGEDRSIVSDVPGTTRDAIDSLFTYAQRRIRLIDTAGAWKKPQAHGSIEYYAALRSVGAIGRCDVAILVIDATAGLMLQDRRLAGMVLEQGKGLIIVGNKWDLVREQGEFQQSDLIAALREQMPFAPFVPITFLSAFTKRRLQSLMPVVLRVAENLNRRIPTAELNATIRSAVHAHPAPAQAGKVLRIFYGAQVAVHPPRFVFHCNDPELVPASYRRFIENTLRANFDFEGVPLDIDFRERTRSRDTESSSS
ncbi:MAG TPA: ribosome biogenesis GTPase Der [Candidatus Baltobacteraceae bacterium]|jgi:GTP-binding protein|nr:ribosome biogenesis GTPase Der [Candidatus Baltobacteraceae bacterium]